MTAAHTSPPLLLYLQSDFTNVRARMAAVPMERHEQGRRFFDAPDAETLCSLLLGAAPSLPRRWPEAGPARAVEHWECEWDEFNGAFEACMGVHHWCADTRAWVDHLPVRGLQMVHASFWERDVHPMASGGSGARAARIFDLEAAGAVVLSLGTHARVFFTSGQRAWREAATALLW